MRTARHLIAVPLLWTAFTCGTAAAPPTSIPQGDRLEFSILRNGERIGSRTVEFTRKGDRLEVLTRVEIVVKFMAIPVYKRTERKRELWRKGVLIEYDDYSDDHGKKSTVRARREAGKLISQGSAGTTETRGKDIMPSTYWNIATVNRTRLLDSTTGAIVHVKVQPVGEEDVAVGASHVQARRYRMTGDLERELWYDENGVWVRMISTASDGSKVEYRRQ